MNIYTLLKNYRNHKHTERKGENKWYKDKKNHSRILLRFSNLTHLKLMSNIDFNILLFNILFNILLRISFNFFSFLLLYNIYLMK